MARNKVLFAPTFSDVAQPVHKRAVGRWQHYAEALAPFTARRDEVLMRHFRASERASRDLTLSATTLAAYRAASRAQWAADEMIQFAQMSSETRFPSFRFARLMAQEARAA